MADGFKLVAGKPTITKDPDAVLDYAVDFAAWLKPLNGDVIASHQVLAVGITIDNSANSDTAVVLWVSGGVVGQPASATVRITTVAGRTDDRTVYFKIKQR